MHFRLAAVLLFCSLSAGAQQINVVTSIGTPADPRPGAEREVSIVFRNQDTPGWHLFAARGGCRRAPAG